MGKQLSYCRSTLDMLILKAVLLGPLHGYGVLLRIQQISGDQLEIQQGSLYPALYLPEGALRARSPAIGVSRRTIWQSKVFHCLTTAGQKNCKKKRKTGTAWLDVIGGILSRSRRKHEVDPAPLCSWWKALAHRREHGSRSRSRAAIPR